ncbi:MAG: AAA family ATPase, partial [Cyanobacteria bacterium SZAS LIN-5]|nr:AAA family ATPase [Cyanobacteria bacterium SZAS LIN-5]
MKILGKNVPRWLLGTTALLAVTGYYTWVYYHVQPDSRDLMVLDEVPAKATGNLDMLVSKMQQSPERYRKFVIVTDHGRPTHAWLVGKDNADDEYAPLDPISSALENAWQTAGAIKCDLDNAPRMLAGDEKSQKCIQRFTSEDTAIAKAEKEKARLSLTDYLLQLAGMLGVAGLAGGLFYWQMQNGGGMSNERKITKAKLELIEPDDKTMRTTFADVKGMNRTVDQLRMILTCLKNPERLAELGGMLQKGLLLVGPPGTGKTLLGRAIAGEAGIPFYSIGGADFQEMLVGVGASRVDDMFREIEEKVRITGKPVILFIDEIDALLLTRAGYDGGSSEKGDTVAAFLKKMDGLKALGKVLIIGATNRPEALDKAATRPGRFGEQIKVLQPNRDGLLDIIKLKLSKVLKKSPDIDPEVLASEFFDSGFTGADVQGVILEQAPIIALMRIEKTGAEVMLTMGDIMLAHE